MQQDTVINIQLDYTQKNNHSLNQITFRSGYSAYEKAQANGTSRFIVQQCCMYKVTNAGYNGKPDWIEFIKICGQAKYDMTSEHMRTFTYIMQNSLTNSVAYYKDIQGKDAADLSEADILETAILFAKGTITGAQELARMADVPDESQAQ